MTRPLATITQSIISKLPVGWAFARRGGVLDTLLGSAAELVSDVEASAEALMAETDPRNARNLLPDFERVLGPDPCGRDLSDLTIAQRQALAHQRWTAFGGQDIPYMIDVAAKLGELIEIFEFWPSKAGGLRSGQRLIPHGEQFLYLVRLRPQTSVIKFRAGASSAGDRLGIFTLSAAECELRRIRPAHTTIVFQYVQPLDLDGEPLVLDGQELVIS